MNRIEVPVNLGTRTNVQVGVAEEIAIALKQPVTPSLGILRRLGELIEDRGCDRMTRWRIDGKPGSALQKMRSK